MSLEKVSAAEFKEIVLEMKPKIGVLGGRHFKTSKRTYTMNQITNKFFELLDSREVSLFGKEGGEISSLIISKDKEATLLLKKASCFQKKMTKIKQKWGNRIYKHRHCKFIGKKSAFEMMSAALLINSPLIPHALGGVDSSKLVSLGDKVIRNRTDFKNWEWETPGAIWTYNKDLIPEDILKKLIRLKKDLACNVKYELGDELTNMEGALHTFLASISRIHVVGDKTWKGEIEGVYGKNFEDNQARQVILSGVVQPDFEFDNVFMEVARILDEAVKGKPLGKKRSEEALRSHMIYHLTQDHRLPGKNEIHEVSLQEVLNRQIQTEKEAQKWCRNKALFFKDRLISLEVMFNTYLHQLRNEMRFLEEALPQGYVYTIDFFNPVQILALKCINKQTPLKHMQVCVIDDHTIISHVQNALPEKSVISSSLLYKGEKGDNTYLANTPEEIKKLCEGAALVIHSNGNGFGQNLEFEGEASFTGVIGTNSDAYATVARDRNDYFVTSAKGEYRPLN